MSLSWFSAYTQLKETESALQSTLTQASAKDATIQQLQRDIAKLQEELTLLKARAVPSPVPSPLSPTPGITPASPSALLSAPRIVIVDAVQDSPAVVSVATSSQFDALS